ncbi:hypothetical protein MMC31_006829 [Peltigera leucophlebia]|nr:hypothetical protein [Peltigera leucophlebia]
MSSIFLWKTTVAVFFLLILAYSSSAQDGFSSPLLVSSSSGDDSAGFMNQNFDLLAGITTENPSEGGDCGGANNVQIQPFGGRKRLLRFRKRGDVQHPTCNWQEFKDNPLPEPGAQPGTTGNPGITDHHGAGTPKVPIKVDSADMPSTEKDRLPDAQLGTPNLEICPGTKSIPVCHYPLLGSVRLNSPVLTLTPCRACKLYLLPVSEAID